MSAHRVSVDTTEADTVDTLACAAFCEDCEWRGEWHHTDTVWVSYRPQGLSPEAEAAYYEEAVYRAADGDAEAHSLDTAR